MKLLQCFEHFFSLSGTYFDCYWVVKPHGIVLKIKSGQNVFQKVSESASEHFI